VGRAIIGGLLTGGIGAIIGGMSGMGQKKVKVHLLGIQFWCIETKKVEIILIELKQSEVGLFIHGAKKNLKFSSDKSDTKK